MGIDLEQITQLYMDGLLSNINTLVALVLSSQELAQSTEDYSTMAKKYQLMVYFADSLYDDECFKRAEVFYNEALKLKRSLSKLKIKTSNSKQANSVTSEVEVKYSLYKCYMKQDNHKDALSTLESIPSKQRFPKINMALGRLYQKHGMERSSLTCYKEVLRSSPFALEAAECLLKLGVPLQEVISLINSSCKSPIPDWLVQYIKGYSFVSLCKYSKAIHVFKSLEAQHLKENTSILSLLGESYYKNNDEENALTCFQQVHSLDKTNLKGMDLFAHILADQSKKTDLQRLAQELSDVTQIKTEPWVAMSYYCSSVNQKARAIYFAQKAHTTDTTNVQALTLKASLLKSLNKHQEAIIHFRESIRLAPNHLDSYEGLVECHISLNRNKEAMNIARNAHKTIGPNSRTLTLCAKVYANESSMQDKAKAMLKKALTHEQSYLPAVYALVDLLIRDEDFENASQIITKQLLTQQTAKLYQLHGDCLKELGKTSESMEQYNKALRLDVDNTKAMDGLQLLERDANSDLDLSSIQEARHRSSIEGMDALGSDRDSPWMD